MGFKKAVRQNVPAKVAIMAPSGNGKTVSALLLAYGLAGEDWDKVYVVDTEHERSLLYTGRTFGDVTIGEFNHLSMEPPYDPRKFIQALEEAEEASGGKGVIIFDSFSNEWAGSGGITSMVDGEGAHLWKEPKQLHKQVVDRIMHSPMDVICTVLTKDKIEIIPGAGRNGKALVQKVPDQPIQEPTFRREFMVVWYVDDEHNADTSWKDNTPLYEGMHEPIKPEHGRMLKEWLKEGKKVKSIMERKQEEEEERKARIATIRNACEASEEVAKLVKNLEYKAKCNLEQFKKSWVDKAFDMVMEKVKEHEVKEEVQAEEVMNDMTDVAKKEAEVANIIQQHPDLTQFVEAFLKGHKVKYVADLGIEKIDLLLDRLHAKIKKVSESPQPQKA